jgi:hypothetical protein
MTGLVATRLTLLCELGQSTMFCRGLCDRRIFAHGGESGKSYCKQRESLWNNPARCLTKTQGSVAW